jgi:type I restriction enzyme S subunit
MKASHLIEIPLGDICGVMSGNAWPASHFNFSGKGLPVIRIQNMEGNNQGTTAYWNGDYPEKYTINNGDLLLSLSGSFKVVRWFGVKSLLNQRIMKLTPNTDLLDEDFLLFQLKHRLFEIEGAATSTAIKNTSLTFLREMKLLVPPLDEQRRIVARIKGCMERLEEIEALRIESIVEACTAIPSMLNEAFLDLSHTYETGEIGDVALETRYGTSKKCSSTPDGTAILRIPNVAGGFVNFDGLKYCVLDSKERKKLALKIGDLLFVRTNGSRDLVGRCAIYEGNGDGQDYGFASYLIRVRLNQKKMRPHFLAFFLNSTHGRAELDKRRRTSAGQFNINSENLLNIEVPLLPLDLQDKIIEELSEGQTRVIQLQDELQAAHKSESHLRESILRKAFSGEF